MRILFATIALLLLVGGAVWFVSTMRQTREESLAPTATPDGGAHPGETQEMREVEDAIPSRAGRTLHVPDPMPAHEPPLTEGLEILVVEGPVEDPSAAIPLPHAEVLFLDLASLREEDEQAFLDEGDDLDHYLAAHSRRFRADGEGRLFLPVSSRGAILRGRTADRSGIRPLLPDATAPMLLELDSDPHLLVRVFDASGAPAIGVPVAVRFEDAEGDVELITARTESPDGSARLRQVEDVADMIEAEGTAYLVPQIPLLEPLEVPFDCRALPAEPLELHLPPCGRLEVRVRGPDGEPPRESMVVSASVLAPHEVARHAPGLAGELPRQITRYPDEEGRVVFDRVAVGGTAAVSAQVPGAPEPVVSTLPGPHAEGETVRIELRLEEVTPVLVGRLFDAGGAPLESVVVEAEIRVEIAEDAWRTRLDRRIRTETDGAFRLPLTVMEHPLFGEDPPVLIPELRISTLATEAEPPKGARLSLPSHLAPGPHDLGDVVLETVPLVASGRVLDTAGEGVEGARVHFFRDARHGFDREPRWVPCPGFRTISRVDGGFEVRGWADEGTYALDVQRRNYLSADRVEFPVGARELAIVLRQGGVIVGGLLLGEEISRRDVHITAVVPETAETVKARAGRSGLFRLRGVPPGGCRVEVAAAEEKRIFENVIVRAGETTRDPRLARIDLRGSLHRFVLEVVDSEGEAVSGFNAYYCVPGGTPSRERLVYGRDGRAEILTTHEVLDVTIVARGYRRRCLERVQGDERIVLEAGIPIRLVVSDLRVFGGDRPRLMVVADPVDSRLPGTSRTAYLTREERGGVMTLAQPGRHVVEILMESPLEGGGSRLRRGPAVELTIDVADQRAEQTFDVPLTLEDLERIEDQ